MPSPLSWPGQCLLCRQWGRERLCAACRQHHLPTVARCPQCALRLPDQARTCGRCLREPPPLARCIAALDYGFPWDRLLQDFKFHARLELAALLSDCLHEALEAGAANRPDLLVPIPLSRERLAERGYNQALELARPLARKRQCPLAPSLLLRQRHTEQQAQLPLEARQRNLRGAFTLTAPVQGLRIALLDDVMTSGATLAEAARTLLRGGAAEVQAWVLARTPEDT